MWDVYTRFGGFTGPNLQNAGCPALVKSDAPFSFNVTTSNTTIAISWRSPLQNSSAAGWSTASPSLAIPTAQTLRQPAWDHLCHCILQRRPHDCIWWTCGSGLQTMTLTPAYQNMQIRTSLSRQGVACTLKARKATARCEIVHPLSQSISEISHCCYSS